MRAISAISGADMAERWQSEYSEIARMLQGLCPPAVLIPDS